MVILIFALFIATGVQMALSVHTEIVSSVELIDAGLAENVIWSNYTCYATYGCNVTSIHYDAYSECARTYFPQVQNQTLVSGESVRLPLCYEPNFGESAIYFVSDVNAPTRFDENVVQILPNGVPYEIQPEIYDKPLTFNYQATWTIDARSGIDPEENRTSLVIEQTQSGSLALPTYGNCVLLPFGHACAVMRLRQTQKAQYITLSYKTDWADVVTGTGARLALYGTGGKLLAGFVSRTKKLRKWKLTRWLIGASEATPPVTKDIELGQKQEVE